MKAYIQLQNLKPHHEQNARVFNGANLTVDIYENHKMTVAVFTHNAKVWEFTPDEYVVLGKEHDTKKPLNRFL